MITVHAFNPCTQPSEELGEFKGNLVYRVSSRSVRVTQRNPVWKTKNNLIINNSHLRAAAKIN